MPVPVPTKPPAPRRWLTVNEAAVYLSVHPRTVRRRIASGEIPASRMRRGSGAIRIAVEDLDNYLRAGVA